MTSTDSTHSTKTIELQNIGPIERLSIPLPEAGVVVLRGRNGVGKSHALAAVDSLVGGRGKPPCRDGAKRAVARHPRRCACAMRSILPAIGRSIR